MLEPTFKTLPEQAVLCATERGMVDQYMSAAADKAFARLKAGAASHGLTSETIATGRWAVFRHIGAYETLWKTWQAIYGLWLPASGLALRQAAPYERYETAPGEVPPERHITDIHVPIV